MCNYSLRDAISALPDHVSVGVRSLGVGTQSVQCAQTPLENPEFLKLN